MSTREVALVMSVLLGAACGTTVPLQKQAIPGSGLVTNSPAQAGAQAAGGAAGGSGPPASQPVATGSPSALPGPGFASVDRSAGGGQPIGSNAPIRVGLMYSSDANAVASSVGGSFSEPDYRVIQNIVVDYVNSTGGVGGHRLVPEYYDASQTKSAQRISEEACASWVQDGHVLAVVPGLAIIDTTVLSKCLNDAHVLALYEGSYSTLDSQSFARRPYWLEPDTMPLNELATMYAQALAEQGFFRGARVGVIYDSYPQFTSVAEKILIPAIRAAGGDVVATFQHGIHSASDMAAGSSQMNSAVLQFKAAHVSKVMFFDAWVGGWIDFAIAASSQGWHPTYGLSSQDGPQATLSTGLIPSDQLPGTVFAGWESVFDVRPEDAGNWARRSTCLDVFRRAKLDVTGLSTDGYGAAMSMCSGLLVLQDAGRLVSGSFTSSALAAAALGLQQHLQSATVPATRFAQDRHFGAAGWRPGAYDESCKCFVYTGPIHTF